MTTTLRKFRIWLGFFIAGLLLSGITAFPLEKELKLLETVLHRPSLSEISQNTGLLPWVTRVGAGIGKTNRDYPFLAYGTDWLAFAHLVIALVFLGSYRDPVRNQWVITFGLLACTAVPLLAFIAGPIRGIPIWWRLVDSSFGVLGAIPLLRCRTLIRQLERQQNERASG